MKQDLKKVKCECHFAPVNQHIVLLFPLFYFCKNKQSKARVTGTIMFNLLTNRELHKPICSQCSLVILSLIQLPWMWRVKIISSYWCYIRGNEEHDITWSLFCWLWHLLWSYWTALRCTKTPVCFSLCSLWSLNKGFYNHCVFVVSY